MMSRAESPTAYEPVSDHDRRHPPVGAQASSSPGSKLHDSSPVAMSCATRTPSSDARWLYTWVSSKRTAPPCQASETEGSADGSSAPTRQRSSPVTRSSAMIDDVPRPE